MLDAQLQAIRDVVQIDVGNRGLRTDPEDNLITACAGDFAAAAALLGAPYRYTRRVTRGQQLGRQLGYPTANLRWLSPLMYGIYAVRVSGAGLDRHPAVASIGTRPTVNGREPLLEVHLFDWSGDLYGQRLTVEFVARQRDELKFDSLDALVQQMDRDAAEARAILAAQP